MAAGERGVSICHSRHYRADFLSLGFPDAVLQMLGAFVSEVCGIKVDFPCFTLDEAMASWQLMDGALRSYEKGRKVLL